MPFQRKSDWKFSWEQDAEKGIEFIRPITTHTLYNHWTLALDAVSDNAEISRKHNKSQLGMSSDRQAVRKPGGILVIHYHDRPIGVLGAPGILKDILLAWRGVEKTMLHPAINDELALLADSAKPAPPQPFNSSILGVQHCPNSIRRFLHEQSEQGGVTAVLYFQTTYAFLVSLPILARFRREAKDGTAWADAVLNWLCLPDHAPVKKRVSELW